MLKKSVLIALALTAIPGAASAATYNISTGYGAAPFSYGSGTAGSTFTPYANSYTGCFSSAALSCKSDGSSSDVPTVLKNNSGAPVTFVGTVTVPGGAVMEHPGSVAGSDAIIRFTAPTTTNYSFSGAFTQYDNTNSGNGTINSITSGGTTLYTNTTGGQAFNVPVGFSGTIHLIAGQTLDFNVNNNGSYTYDSTGVSGLISVVPEPATWAMMILGMGAVGATMRRRKAATNAAFA